MKRLAKYYPRGSGEDPSQLAKAVVRAGLSGLQVPAWENGRAHFPSQILPASDFSLLDLSQALRAEGLLLGLVMPFFHDPTLFEEARPQTPDGPWPQLDWYRPLCPTTPGLAQSRIELAMEAVELLNPDMAGLDFFRFPVFWESASPQGEISTPRGCHCPRCQKLPQGPQGYINQLARQVRAALPDTALTVHTVPFHSPSWREMTGQNPKDLAQILGVISPMLYHRLMKATPDWVLQRLGELESLPLWPSLQASDVSYQERLAIEEQLEGLECLSYFHWGFWAGDARSGEK